jgi:hypothetical protein
MATSIGSAHVDFSAEGLPELLKGVTDAASALKQIQPPTMIDASQAAAVKSFMQDSRERVKLQKEIAAGNDKIKTSSFGGLKEALFDKRALDDGFRTYQSQAKKADAIDNARKKSLQELAGFVNRQFGGNIDDPGLPEGTKESVRFAGAGGTLPMRESLLNQRESFEEKRGRFGSGEMHRDPVAFMDQMLTSGRASGDITSGSEYETFLKAMRQQTVVSEGDSEAVTRAATMAEKQMAGAAGDTGAVRLAQRFQGQAGERQGRTAERDMLGVSAQEFSRMQSEQVVAQTKGKPDDSRAELARVARDTADHIAAQGDEASNVYYDNIQAKLRKKLNTGKISEADFASGVALSEASRSRDQDRKTGIQGRNVDRAMMGVSGQEFAETQRKQIVALTSSADDARPELAQAARDAAEHIAAKTRQAAGEYYDTIEAGLQHGLSKGRIGDTQFETGVARAEAGRSRDENRTSGLMDRRLGRENVGGMITQDAGRISTGGFAPEEELSQFAIMAKDVYSRLEQQLEDALTRPFDEQRRKLLENAQLAAGPGKELDPGEREELRQDLGRVDRDEDRERKKESLGKSLQSEADALERGGSLGVQNAEDEIAVLKKLRTERGGVSDAVKDHYDAQIALKESQVPLLRQQDELTANSTKLITKMNQLKNVGREGGREYKDLAKQLSQNRSRISGLSAATGGFNRSSRDMAQGQRKVTFMMQQGSYAVQDFVQVIGQTGLSGALRASANNVAQVAATFGTMGGAIASAGITLLMIGIAEALTYMGGESKEAAKNIEKLTTRLEGLLSIQKQLRAGRLEIQTASADFGASRGVKFSGEGAEKAFEGQGLRDRVKIMQEQVADDFAGPSLAGFGNRTSLAFQDAYGRLQALTDLIPGVPDGLDAQNAMTDTHEERVIRVALSEGKAAAQAEANRLSQNVGPREAQKLQQIAAIDPTTVRGKAKLLEMMNRMDEFTGEQKKLYEESLELVRQAGQAEQEALAQLALFTESLAKTTEALNEFMAASQGQIRFGSGEANLASAEGLAGNIGGAQATLSYVETQLKNVQPGSEMEAALIQQRDNLVSLIEQFHRGIGKFLDANGPFGSPQLQKIDKIRSEFVKRRAKFKEEVDDPVLRAKAKTRFDQAQARAEIDHFRSSRFKRKAGETSDEFKARIRDTTTRDEASSDVRLGEDIRRREAIGGLSAAEEELRMEADLPGLDRLSASLFGVEAQAASSEQKLIEWAHVLGKTPAEIAAATAALNKFIAAQKNIARLEEAKARLKSKGEAEALTAGHTDLDAAQQKVKQQRIDRLLALEADDAAGILTPQEKQGRAAQIRGQYHDDMQRARRQDAAKEPALNASFADRWASADSDLTIEEQRAKIKRDLENKIREIEADTDFGNQEEVAAARHAIAAEAAIAGAKDATLGDAPVGITDIGSLHSQIQTSLKGNKQLDAQIEGNRILGEIQVGISQLGADFTNIGKITQ